MKTLALAVAVLVAGCVGRPPDSDDGAIPDAGPPAPDPIVYECTSDAQCAATLDVVRGFGCATDEECEGRGDRCVVGALDADGVTADGCVTIGVGAFCDEGERRSNGRSVETGDLESFCHLEGIVCTGGKCTGPLFNAID